MSAVKTNDRPTAAVLFSGGRDSTLAAAKLLGDGWFVHLVSFDSGLSYGNDLRHLRLEEMRGVFGEDSFVYWTSSNAGLLRRICFVDLVEDIKRDDCQLILLGASLAMVGRAIAYCRSRGVTTLASGAVGYQDHFPEQQPATLTEIRAFSEKHGVRFLTPLAGYETEVRVRHELLDLGLSAKSLEASALLADLEDDPAPEAVTAYVRRKLPLLDEYLKGALPAADQ